MIQYEINRNETYEIYLMPTDICVARSYVDQAPVNSLNIWTRIRKIMSSENGLGSNSLEVRQTQEYIIIPARELQANIVFIMYIIWH